MSEDKHLVTMGVALSEWHRTKIKEYALKNNLSVSRVIAFAVDNELQKDNPFEFNTELPTQEYTEYTFADEAGKILNFIKTLRNGSAGLDILLLLRYTIGVPDKDIFLAAFKDCLDRGMIESFMPAKIRYENYLYYRLAGQPTTRSRRMREKSYKEYQRLKKKFEGDE